MAGYTVLAVGTGGFFGAVFRYLLSTGMHKIAGVSFPYGTLFVNVLGSFLIGFLFLYFEESVAPAQKALLVTGMLGALTTFSTFSLESVLILQDGLYLKAFLNMALNVVFSVSATVGGMFVFHKLYGL